MTSVIVKGLYIDPNSDTLLSYKGRALMALGKYGEAIAAFDQSIAIDSESFIFSVIAAKANAYYKMCNYREALKYIKQAHEGLQASDFYGYSPFGIKQIQKTVSEQVEIAREIEQKLIEETLENQGKLKGPNSTKTLSSKERKHCIEESQKLGSMYKEDLERIKQEILAEFSASMVKKEDISYYLDKNKAKMGVQEKLNLLEDEPRLKEYYEMLVGTCSSHYVSAKAADGKFVAKAKLGIPLIESIPLPTGFDMAVKLVNGAIRVKQKISQSNALERTKALSPTVTDFEKQLKAIALEVTMQKSDTIKAVQITQTGMFGLLNKIKKLTEKAFEDNCKTAAQKLALQDALKMITCWETKAYDDLPGHPGTTMAERCIKFIVDQTIENSLLEQLKAGAKLVNPESASSSSTSPSFVRASPHTIEDRQDKGVENEPVTLATYRPKHAEETMSNSPINSSTSSSHKTSKKDKHKGAKKDDHKEEKCIVMMMNEIIYDNPELVGAIQKGAELYSADPFTYETLKTLGAFSFTDSF